MTSDYCGFGVVTLGLLLLDVSVALLPGFLYPHIVINNPIKARMLTVHRMYVVHSVSLSSSLLLLLVVVVVLGYLARAEGWGDLICLLAH